MQTIRILFTAYCSDNDVLRTWFHVLGIVGGVVLLIATSTLALMLAIGNVKAAVIALLFVVGTVPLLMSWWCADTMLERGVTPQSLLNNGSRLIVMQEHDPQIPRGAERPERQSSLRILNSHRRHGARGTG